MLLRKITLMIKAYGRSYGIFSTVMLSVWCLIYLESVPCFKIFEAKVRSVFQVYDTIRFVEPSKRLFASQRYLFVLHTDTQIWYGLYRLWSPFWIYLTCKYRHLGNIVYSYIIFYLISATRTLRWYKSSLYGLFVKTDR